MKLNEYIKDKILIIILNLFTIFIVNTLFYLFRINNSLIIIINIIFIINVLFIFISDYVKRKIFYDNLEKNLNNLDNKPLITELINNTDFIDSVKIKEYLYEINKNYLEQINKLRKENIDFEEYIELWCHEIKTPIATTKLIIDNNKNDVTRSILEEVLKEENYLEQVLFYAKSSNCNDDYIVSKINLNNVIQNVIKRNKKDILNNKIKINYNNEDIFVNSDSKWLEFIINQIVVNSIKYKSINPYISFDIIKNKDNYILTILDNGIGINDSDIDKVFNKGFTGVNGRSKYNSTGMGLYLSKKLLDKLGHSIKIESIKDEYTKVSIIIPNSSMINLTNM